MVFFANIEERWIFALEVDFTSSINWAPVTFCVLISNSFWQELQHARSLALSMNGRVHNLAFVYHLHSSSSGYHRRRTAQLAA